MTDSLRTLLEQDMKQAMRDKENEKRDAIRYILAMVKNVEIDKRAPLTPEEEIGVLRSQIKQRQDSIEQFRNGGREDLAAKEASQVAILEKYLPQQMDNEELAAFVRQGVLDAGAASPKDMGKVIGLLNKRSDGRADGRRLSSAVKAALTES